MLPLFGDNDTRRRRQINLGGASSAASHTAILGQAKARRQERDEQRRRHDSAVRVQAWWRGIKEVRAARAQMRKAFEADVGGLTGLRCLVLMGRDADALGAWSSAVTSGGEEVLLRPLAGPNAQSWLVLLRPVTTLLLRSLADEPQSTHALAHLQVLNTLLTTSATTRILGPPGAQATYVLTQYLLQNSFYPLLSSALIRIPLERKSSPSLARIVPLVMAPIATFSPSSSASSPVLYTVAFVQLTTHILTLPLLPNRLPLSSLTHLSANLPLSSLNVILPQIPDILATLGGMPNALEQKINLLANLLAFAPPRYGKLPAPALDAYLRLLVALLNDLPANVLETPAPVSLNSSGLGASASAWPADSDESDEDDEHVTTVRVVSSFIPSVSAPSAKPRAAAPKLDARTYNRLSTLPSPAHLTALLAASQHAPATRPALFACLLALTAAWPTRREKVLSTALTHAGGGLARELYRGWVRGSSLGRDAGALSSVFDPAHASAWPPLLLLVELYTQTLLTMGDDEFFSTSGERGGGHGFTLAASTGPSSLISGAASGGGTAPPPRNPLTLDELTSFSRQLLNIAFALYWREDLGASPTPGTSVDSGTVPGLGASMRWEVVRDRLTKCLQAIHARDSRRSFTPPDHWLVTSQIDVQPFVEAALLDGQQLSAAVEALPGHTRARGGNARSLTKRQVAALSPRLGVLNNIPFAIPFDVRVSVFRGWVARDMIERAGGSTSGGWTQPDRITRMMIRGVGARTRAVVRRGNIAQDGFDRLADADLKAPIEITFIDQWGNEEAGIDGGGVFKEFFTSLCKEVFDTDRGLWLTNKKNELYPNPHSYATEGHSLNWYRFIGRILGKALYEGILVDVAFAGFFLAKWLGKQSFLDDLASLDPDLYQGLIFLKHYTGNPEDLSLNFTVGEEEFGVTKSVDLVPDGSNIPVTRENRLQYVYLVSHYRLTKQIKRQSEAFFEGLSEIIDPKWLRMFNQQELQILLGGVNSPIDLEDLRQNTSYGGLYDDQQETIALFWKVVDSFDHDQRRNLLRFVTSCSRPPLLGFKELAPNFAIRDAGGDEARLPTSSTCVNLLKLPRYRDERVLRTKLLQAINSNAGFDLS